MHPELQEVIRLNNEPMSRDNAQAFLNYINTHFSQGWENEPNVRIEVNEFLGKLSTIDETWAVQIRNAIEQSRSDINALSVQVSPRPIARPTRDVQNIGGNISSIAERPEGEYRRIYEYVLGASEYQISKGNINLYYFQAYYNQLNGTSYGVDGAWGNESNTMIHTDIFATQWLLRKLGAKGNDGNALVIDGIIGPDYRDAIKQFFNADIHIDSPAPGVGISAPEELVIIQRVIPSLESLGVSESQAQTLAREVIGTPLTPESISRYQSQHNIGVDGIIGTETYLEMRAGKMLFLLTEVHGSVTNVDQIMLTVEGRQEILFLFKYSNLEGEDMKGIRGIVTMFKQAHENDSDFDRIYGDFYRAIGAEVEAFRVTQQGQEAAGTPTQQDTIYNMVQEGRWEDIIKDPTLLMIGGILFLFGVVGGDTRFTDSFLKRLGWVVGIGLFGEAAWNKLGGADMIADARNAIGAPRSADAQKAIDDSSRIVENVFKNMWEGGVSAWDNVSAEVMAFFGETTRKFELQNQREATAGTDGEPSENFIEQFTEKWAVISSDETFLLTSRDILLALSDKTINGLASILSPEALGKLNEYNITDRDVRNLLDLYIIPEAQKIQAQNDATVRIGDIFISAGTYLSTTLQSTGNDIASWVNSDFFETSSLNSQIQSELSTLIYTGTAAQNKAAQELGGFLSRGRFEDFDLENYPELSVTEKTEFTRLQSTISNIYLQEEKIANYILLINELSISNIDIVTPTIVEDRWKILLDKKDEYLKQRDEIRGVGVTTERLDIVIAAREQELLEKARELGMTTLIGVNINTALGEVIDSAAIASSVSEFEDLRSSLETLPTENQTPKIFKSYYESNKHIFEAASNIPDLSNNAAVVIGSNEARLSEIAKDIRAQQTLFLERYEVVKATYVTKFANVQSGIDALDVTGINTESAFNTTRAQYDALAQEYEVLISEVQDGFEPVEEVTDFWNRYVNGQLTFNDTDNAFKTIDGAFSSQEPSPDYEGVQTALELKNREFDNKFKEITLSKILATPLSEILNELNSVLAPYLAKFSVEEQDEGENLYPGLEEGLLRVFSDYESKNLGDLLGEIDGLIAGNISQNNTLAVTELGNLKASLIATIEGNLSQEVMNWFERFKLDAREYIPAFFQ